MNVAKRMSVMLLAVALLTAPADAALVKYKQWERSPEAYFLTTDERLAWMQVKTDTEAERFVSAYMARRGKEFAAELRNRIAVADRYFSAGKVRGSTTVRGRIAILFGPPSRVERSGGMQVAVGDPMAGDIYTNAGPAGAGATEVRVEPLVYTFTYNGSEVARRLRRPELVIAIEVDAVHNREKIRSREQELEVQRISQKIAEWSIDAGTAQTRIASFQ